VRLRIVAIVIYCLVVGWLVISSTHRNGGDFTYPLDDTYIHLAVAKNLASDGVWGITPNHFTSCTSSVSWPLALAASGAAMPWAEWLPLILNLIFGVVVLILVDGGLREQAVGNLVRFGVLAGFVIVVPLSVLTVVGLEHVAQIAFAIALLRWGVEMIDGPDPGDHRLGRGLVLAVLLVATRFEGVFLVASIAWLLQRRGRRRSALLLVLAGALPLVVFGLISFFIGGRFLPTPIWMKGKLGSELLPALLAASSDPVQWIQLLFDFFILSPLRSLAEVGVLSWLVLLALARLIWTRTQGTRLVGLWIVLATTWMHLVFARTGWLGRYEAWLIAMLAMVLAPFAQEIFDGGRRQRWPVRLAAVVLLLVFGLFPVRERVASTMFQANRGSTNIYEQQVQMARFLDHYRSGEAVGMNDIGAINFFADVDCVDLWGLSDNEIADLRMEGELDPIEIEWITRQRAADVVVMYESVLAETGGAPKDWDPVADWRIWRNAVCGSSRVTWFATSAAAAPKLRAQLEEWLPELPGTVGVQWR
jgi:hypothetical protein